ncbi:MAG TPA: CoA transferase [Acidimicrobiales bacterium]
MSDGPLSGVRVLDFCHFLAGPYATLILAELGADVIKIEDPERPDEARHIGPKFVNDESLYFLSLNWGKRSLGVRLSTEQGRRVVMDLVRTSDAVVDNYRPGVMAKLGLDHDALAAVNNRIVTCSLTGFGATGPYADRPGYDYTIQALAGVMSLTGEPDSPPGKAGISYVDHSGGMGAALAVCSALIERGRTGRGRHIDLSLLDIQVSMLTYLASWQLNSSFEPSRTPSAAHPSIVPAQNFPTSDGYVAVFVGNDPMWKRFAAAAGDARLNGPEFVTHEQRFNERKRLIPLLEDILRTAPSADWVQRLSSAGVPCAPVNDLGEALEDPHVSARGLVATASHDRYGTYRHVRGPLGQMVGEESGAEGAPLLGEDTRRVLAEIGYTDDLVASLLATGVVASADAEHR